MASKIIDIYMKTTSTDIEWARQPSVNRVPSGCFLTVLFHFVSVLSEFNSTGLAWRSPSERAWPCHSRAHLWPLCWGRLLSLRWWESCWHMHSTQRYFLTDIHISYIYIYIENIIYLSKFLSIYLPTNQPINQSIIHYMPGSFEFNFGDSQFEPGVQSY